MISTPLLQHCQRYSRRQLTAWEPTELFGAPASISTNQSGGGPRHPAAIVAIVPILAALGAAAQRCQLRELSMR